MALGLSWLIQLSSVAQLHPRTVTGPVLLMCRAVKPSELEAKAVDLPCIRNRGHPEGMTAVCGVHWGAGFKDQVMCPALLERIPRDSPAKAPGAPILSLVTLPR